MQNPYKSIVSLFHKCFGAEAYKIEEIARLMERSENVDQSTLIDFAQTVRIFLDNDSEEFNYESKPAIKHQVDCSQ